MVGKEKEKMSFTDQKPFVVNQKTFDAYARIKKPFNCSLCGHKFAVGDKARWVYANSTKDARCGNFFVCADCDGDGVLQRGIESHKLATKLAIQWGIYGPDWQREYEREER